MQKQTIADRLDRVDDFATLEDLQRFMDSRAGALQFSAMRPMQVDQSEAALSRLVDRLVEQEKPARPRSRAKTLFAEALEKENLIERVRQSIAVELPRIGKVLKANYGYKNGRFNGSTSSSRSISRARAARSRRRAHAPSKAGSCTTSTIPSSVA